MTDSPSDSNVLENSESQNETLKKTLPKQVTVYIGEYPIKLLLKQPYVDAEGRTLNVLIDKSSDEIRRWLPKGFKPYLVLGFEDAHIETHFWYNVFPFVSQDHTLTDSLKKKPTEKLSAAIIVASLWDGVGSGSLPSAISKFKALDVDSFSVAILPSKIQPADAHFNALAALGLTVKTDAATLLLLDRDLLESYKGVNRNGSPIKGNQIADYLANLFFSKETFVQEITEQSRAFNAKIYTPLFVTGASFNIYGSIENMLDASLLRPLLSFDLSKVSLLYGLVRMPASMKDKLPRAKIELAIASWIKQKTTLKSIHITEPVYVEDASDRVDILLLVAGFEITEILLDYEKKSKSLRSRAMQRKLVKKEDWQSMMNKLGIGKEEAASAQAPT